MFLVDTSVWIKVFQKSMPLNLSELVSFDEMVTSLPIIQEVLQGFREEDAYRVAREAMFSLPIVDSPLPRERVEEAVSIYRTARKNGLTIRSSVDCLIGASAIFHNLTVLHTDRDFSSITKISSLKVKTL